MRKRRKAVTKDLVIFNPEISLEYTTTKSILLVEPLLQMHNRLNRGYRLR